MFSCFFSINAENATSQSLQCESSSLNKVLLGAPVQTTPLSTVSCLNTPALTGNLQDTPALQDRGQRPPTQRLESNAVLAQTNWTETCIRIEYFLDNSVDTHKSTEIWLAKHFLLSVHSWDNLQINYNTQVHLYVILFGIWNAFSRNKPKWNEIFGLWKLSSNKEPIWKEANNPCQGDPPGAC